MNFSTTELAGINPFGSGSSSDVDRTGNIPKFGGTIYYVSHRYGDDSFTGLAPNVALKTIGSAIGKLVEGDAINIRAGDYTEVGLDLNVNDCELWFEIGAIITPATGTGLIISGDYCSCTGRHQINVPAGETGLLVSGNACHLEHARILSGAKGLSVTGTGCTIENTACGNQTSKSFDIQGDQTRVLFCSTVGIGASQGFYINNSSDTGVLQNCTSVGHSLNGFYISSGSSNWTIIDCSSGRGDGKWIDVDSANSWSGFTYQETKFKEIILDNTHEYPLFKITGSIEIDEIFGHVTTDLTGANSSVYWQLYSATSNDSITKTTDADMGAAVVGSVIIKTENPDKKATFFDGAGVGVDKGIDPKKKTVVINANNNEDTFIRWICGDNNDTSGVIHFHVAWRPLTDDGFLVVV